MRRALGVLALLLAAPAAVLAHHRWGSYDASKTVVVQGPIEQGRQLRLLPQPVRRV